MYLYSKAEGKDGGKIRNKKTEPECREGDVQVQGKQRCREDAVMDRRRCLDGDSVVVVQ